jgi:hypothetical protein
MESRKIFNMIQFMKFCPSCYDKMESDPNTLPLSVPMKVCEINSLLTIFQFTTTLDIPPQAVVNSVQIWV